MATQALDDVVSHWSVLLEGFEGSSQAFYQAIEASVGHRSIPNSSYSRIEHHEGGVGSPKREYLRISRENLFFDVCGAPFGSGFFVSSWLSEDVFRLNGLAKAGVILLLFVVAGWFVINQGLIVGPFLFLALLLGGLAFASELSAKGELNDRVVRALPILGPMYIQLFRPATFYRIDSMEMFQKSVHNAVMEVIDAMTAEQGIMALSEDQRKPVMRQFYERRRR